MSIQSIIFDKTEWSQEQARKWVHDNNFKESFFGKPMDETRYEYRFRQEEPITEQQKEHGSYYTTDKNKVLVNKEPKYIKFVIKHTN
jgi:hypothetical protein